MAMIYVNEDLLFRFIIRIDEESTERTFIVRAETINQAENLLWDELYGYEFTILERAEEDRDVFALSQIDWRK
jgi:hypothetical protein